MISVKNGHEVECMRRAGSVAAQVLSTVKNSVKEGITTKDLDELAGSEISRLDAESACLGYQLDGRRFPGFICVSLNEEVVHGIGSYRRVLKDGDIVSLDVVVRYGGFIGDTACTVPVGEVSEARRRLLAVTEEALSIGIGRAQIGNRIGDISNAIQRFVEAEGFSVVREMVGHGVGRRMHEEPQIPNFGRRGNGPIIQAGMTLAIEPMVNLGSRQTLILSDGWTVVTKDRSASAHFEHTVLTTGNGPLILTDSSVLWDKFHPRIHPQTS